VDALAATGAGAGEAREESDERDDRAEVDEGVTENGEEEVETAERVMVDVVVVSELVAEAVEK
jgi:hypothetical protein